MKPTKFLLPILFLFILGMGNILVGTFKELQYKQVYSELEQTTELQYTPVEEKALGGLRATQLAAEKLAFDRYSKRKMDASERRNLYLMVIFGGKIFLTTAILLGTYALLLAIYQRKFSKPSQAFSLNRHLSN